MFLYFFIDMHFSLRFFLTQATTHEAGFQWLGCSGRLERSTLGDLLGSGPGLQLFSSNVAQNMATQPNTTHTYTHIYITYDFT